MLQESLLNQFCDPLHRYTREIPEPALFWSRHGAQIGKSSGFSCNQNYCSSLGAYVTCIYCGLSMKINTRKTPHNAWRSWTHLFCVCFWVCGWQTPEGPDLSPMTDSAITRDGIQGLGSPLYICGSLSKFEALKCGALRYSKGDARTVLHLFTSITGRFKD